ncbi:MAG TPA: ABC transporter ATP-binding protein [Acidimicrobiales bacterium]|nr:ABC transporter ATP-binding protein [Acidimicrobiales bacterium]
MSTEPPRPRSPRRFARRLDVLFGTAFRAAPGLAVLSIVLSLVSGLAGLAYPIGFRLLIDSATQHDVHGLAVAVALIAVAFSLSWVIAVTSAVRNSRLTDRCNLALGERIARLATAAPTLEHFERSDYLQEIDNLRANRRTLAGSPRQVLSFVQLGVQAAGTLALLAAIYPPVLLIPLLAVVPGLADRRAGQMQKRSDDDLAEGRRLVAELFTLASTAGPARELRTYGATGAVVERHARLSAQLNAKALGSARRSALVEAAGWIVYAAGFVAGIVLLVLRAAHGQASPGEVVESVSLVRRAQRQVNSTNDTAGSFATGLRTADRLLWLEDYVRNETRAAALPPPPTLAAGIALENVSFCYPKSDTPALSGVELFLPAGAIVALVGENGAGKTTLVKLLTGMYRPSAGRITVDGTDLAELDLSAWRERTSATFQDHVAFQMRLGDGVGVGDLPRLEDAAAVTSAIERADAAGIVEQLPEGIDTLVGSYVGGRGLSGGQWQRLALARGLMRDEPLLVVLDEPTASLDALSEARLFRSYRAAAAGLGRRNGTITLLVSHRFSTVDVADLIVVCDGGTVVEQGTHDELVAAGGLYAELFALQAAGYRPTPES